jgi:hypothetical protein
VAAPVPNLAIDRAFDNPAAIPPRSHRRAPSTRKRDSSRAHCMTLMLDDGGILDD